MTNQSQRGGNDMLEERELVKTVDLMLRCTGYWLRGDMLGAYPTTMYRPTAWIIRARPNICWKPENIVYEFIDEYSEANKNGVFWWEGDVLNFLVTNNFVQINAPWYKQLPVLQMSYDTAKNTAWFFFRMHAVVGRVEKDQIFKANRVPNLLKEMGEEVSVEQFVEKLETCYDPEMTPEVLEAEIETGGGEQYGLPNIIHFLKERGLV